MKEYVNGCIRLICDDNRNWTSDYLKSIGVDTILTDPPYSINNNCDYTRFTGGLAPNNKFQQVIGDDRPFDPTPFLNYKNVLLWGANHYADKLPKGSWLIWKKKPDNLLGKFLSDGEIAWQNHGNGVYIFPHTWHGFIRESERGKSQHPTEKPIALMNWCLFKIKSAKFVYDPYMGTGPIAVSCLAVNIPYIGIEISEEYFEKAIKKVEKFIDERNKINTK